MGRHKLRTMNTHFIDGNLNAQRYSDEILRPIVVPFSAAITSCFSMLMHGPVSKGSVYNYWKLKMSQFFHGLHSHETCQPLSTFVMLWINMQESVFQFPPIISSNFLYFFISPLFNHVGQLRTSYHLQLRPGQDKA